MTSTPGPVTNALREVVQYISDRQSVYERDELRAKTKGDYVRAKKEQQQPQTHEMEQAAEIERIQEHVHEPRRSGVITGFGLRGCGLRFRRLRRVLGNAVTSTWRFR